MKAYKVSEYRGWWGDDKIKYWDTYKKALDDFKTRVQEYRKNKNLVKDISDLSYNTKRAIEISSKDERLDTKGVKKQACIELWYSSTSEDGTEWDTDITTINIEEIEIE